MPRLARLLRVSTSSVACRVSQNSTRYSWTVSFVLVRILARKYASAYLSSAADLLQMLHLSNLLTHALVSQFLDRGRQG